MDGYWWGVLTPFAIILGILLLYLTGNLFGAIVSWAWKKAHYGLLKKGWIAEDYDEDSTFLAKDSPASKRSVGGG